MRKQIVQDERILAQKRKIGSDTCYLLMIILFISILVQQYLFDAPFTQYAVELIGFFGALIYILIRNLILGNNLFNETENAKKLVVVNSVICGLLVSVINGVLKYPTIEEYVRNNWGFFIFTQAITFVAATVFTFAVFFIIYLLNNKRQKQIDKKLNEDDDK